MAKGGLTDGSGGIRGGILRADTLAEVKAYFATALSIIADGLRPQRRYPLGLGVFGTARDAAQGGASKVLSDYAAQILEAIKKDGLYVRVPAGKTFYVYLTQIIDKDKVRASREQVSNGY